MTQTFKRSGDMIEIGDSIRIEPGPPLIKADATNELLANDKTAVHYQAPRPATEEEIASPSVLTEGDQRLFLDAKGDPIRLGKPMHYLDWLGFQAGDDSGRVFYLYQKQDRTPDEIKALEISPDDDQTVWREIATYPTEDEAISAALAL